MERELIIPIDTGDFDLRKFNLEVDLIKKLIPFFESFYSFYQNNEVFDFIKHRRIVKKRLLKQFFYDGLHKKKMCFTICKN